MADAKKPDASNDFHTMGLRVNLESIGFTLKWDDATKTATVLRDDKVVTTVTQDKNAYVVDGKTIQLECAPVNREGRLHVPASFFSKVIGAKLTYKADGELDKISYKDKSGFNILDFLPFGKKK